MRELHFLGLFPHYYLQDSPRQSASGNQHLSIWEMPLKNEREYGDCPREEKAEQRAF